MTLACLVCLASQFCTELGPAQPGLVYNLSYVMLNLQWSTFYSTIAPILNFDFYLLMAAQLNYFGMYFKFLIEHNRVECTGISQCTVSIHSL